MNINKESRFNEAPVVNTPRSTFLMHQNIRTTFNAAKLIPFYVDSDIMPGDTFQMKGTFVVRQSTPIYPTMDNSFLDVFFFFVPHRLVWEHWKEFWGENTTGAWTQQTTYTIPQIIMAKTNTANDVAKGGWANYMGIPLMTNNATGISVNALPFRAYAQTWNDWFRDENVCPPLYIYKGDANRNLSTGTTYKWGNYTTTGSAVPEECAPVYKYKDYFNACLPEPQKGAPVTLPLGDKAEIYLEKNTLTNLNFWNGTTLTPPFDAYTGNLSVSTTYSPTGIIPSAISADGVTSNVNGIAPTLANADTKANMYADLSNAVAATINAQRMAFAAQRILEAKARTGSRYFEICDALFQVKGLSSAVQQRPELLGARHIPITMNQVAQTSSTDNTSPQGNVAAYSLTVDSNHMFTKSFTEHGTILGLLCVRQEHSYDQGLARMWSRKNLLDFYTPQMAFLGEQAVLNKEIYLTAGSTDDQVFGYNERWAELRYKPNINTGAFSTKYAQSLDSWHYGDSYSALPVLSDAWRRETKDYIDRTLAVQSSVEDQYIMDSRLEMKATRPLPLYSIPGLMDHF